LPGSYKFAPEHGFLEVFMKHSFLKKAALLAAVLCALAALSCSKQAKKEAADTVVY
jgi:hypothetical protein